MELLGELTLDEALDEFESAEDFLTYFAVPFDPAVEHVSRLHILQRFHNYLAQAAEPEGDDARRYAIYKAHLERAYADFVESSPLEEKVFKVFRMHEPQVVYIPVTSISVR